LIVNVSATLKQHWTIIIFWNKFFTKILPGSSTRHRRWPLYFFSC